MNSIVFTLHGFLKKIRTKSPAIKVGSKLSC